MFKSGDVVVWTNDYSYVGKVWDWTVDWGVASYTIQKDDGTFFTIKQYANDKKNLILV